MSLPAVSILRRLVGRLALLAWFVVGLCSGTGRADEVGAWNSVLGGWQMTERLTLWGLAETRWRDGDGNLGTYLATARVAYRPQNWLETSVGYGHLEVRRPGAMAYRQQNRMELELNPRWRLGEHWVFNLRNRVEIRWIENAPRLNLRNRHRLQIDYEHDRKGWFRGLFWADEVFYDHDLEMVTENRLVPAGAAFNLGPQTQLRVSYQLQSIRLAQSWHQGHILGTQLMFQF